MFQEWKSAGAWRLEFEFYVDNDPFRGSAPGPETDFDFLSASPEYLAQWKAVGSQA